MTIELIYYISVLLSIVSMILAQWFTGSDLDIPNLLLIIGASCIPVLNTALVFASLFAILMQALKNLDKKSMGSKVLLRGRRG